MAARCTDTIVYRSLPVNGEQLRALMLGQNIKSKNPQATASIRDHVLLGSKADFRSQFISTTGSLDIALKYAVPVHTIIAIDLAKYQLRGGKMYDLSTDERFSENVFPMKGDISNSAAVKRRMDMEFGTDKHDLYTVDMYANAALTNWECCCLFSVRSCEVLLEGEIPFDCLSVISYTTHVQSVTNLPYQPHEIPFESFSTSVAADQTRYADGDNGGLIEVTLLSDTKNRYLLKQAKRNSLETGVLSSRELRSSIDLEFAAFDTYRRVAHHVPDLGIAVRDCIKISFRYEISGELQGSGNGADSVLNCLLFRCINQPYDLLPVEVLVIDRAHVKDAYMGEFGENYEMPIKPQMSTLQLMQKAAKKAGDVLSPEMIRMWEQKGGLHYVRFHFCPADCKQLFKGLAVDLLVGNKYAGGCYEKAGIARSSTGELYRLSADRALGNQVAESLNADRRDDHAGNLLIDSISIAAKWGHIPMHKLCSELKRTLHAIRRAVEANYEEFNSDVFRRLDLPYDVKRCLLLRPDLHSEVAKHDDMFKRISVSVIWDDYLVNRCNSLCFKIDRLEVRSRNKEMLNTAIVLEDLHNLFNFMRGHSPFDPILPP
uniref:Uncharacterized protein n=1 Tax=Spumella elongata TaxID=89044 RepID=A0A7S3HHL8_9STRA|mmetsp:Transcript_51713/g.90215  ORF Transcript_51713/g.90215 Transcript_51713/m.90215 type:complete len:601 (+) Transcript_51713:2-1804(+)